ncbi:hypothetical protein H4R19_004816 [Coemansia spiralis]|nr:hypothetical protein H4R19_004816 [Coemansia spiralis]
MFMPAHAVAAAPALCAPAGSGTLSNEQLAAVATRAFAKLWMVRHTHESLHQFQAFCFELLCSTQIAVPIVMLALLYVDQFRRRYPRLHGGHGSEYRMFVVALMLASKFLEDNTFTTQTWSEVSHLPARELAIMQREFLVALDHRLHVGVADYRAWMSRLQSMVTDGAAKSHAMSPSAFVPAEMHTPADSQVVPSPPAAFRVHELPAADLLPSPSAKRARYAAHMRPALEPIAVSAQPLMQPLMYTPPASAGVGFAPADFTFKVPTLPHSAAGAYFAPPQAVRVAPVFSTAPGYLAPSIAPVSAGPVAQTLPHHPIGQFSAPPPLTTRYSAFAQSCDFSQHPQAGLGMAVSADSVAAAAAALASHYPTLCYTAHAFAPAGGAALPIYNYGA